MEDNEDYMETIVFQNQAIIDLLGEIKELLGVMSSELQDVNEGLSKTAISLDTAGDGISDIKHEMNWLNDNSLAAVVRDGFSGVDNSLFEIRLALDS